MIRTLIVDDERLARLELRRLLAAHPEVEILGEATDGLQAEAMIRDLPLDLVLLDVQMPGKTGFEVLESLAETPPVIFTTAYDQFALRAFEVSALDYLLKPVDARRLAEALGRVGVGRTLRLETGRAEAGRAETGRLEPVRRFFVKDGDRCWFLQAADVALFESEGNYTRLYLEGARPMILRSLVEVEERLDGREFFRASRKHVINLQAIAQMRVGVSGNLEAVLRGGQIVELSKRQSALFRQRMSL